jgi:molybdopterin/thiamine biosynthesis adenylyltransferase
MTDDLQEEFFSYWQGGCCLIDLSQTDSGRVSGITFGKNNDVIVTDDIQNTFKKLPTLRGKGKISNYPIYKIVTTACPRPLIGSWPPKNVGDILFWQRKLDKNCCLKIENKIAEAYRLKYEIALIVIESPLMMYGLFVCFNQEKTLSPGKRAGKLKEYLYSQPIVPMTVFRLDDRYLAERNIPGKKTLAAKRICLVGCGTIGGYLAEMLVKAGAGTLGGKLILVDNDILAPQNLGRHRLGFSHLFGNKAEKLAEELYRTMPTSDVKVLPVDIREAFLSDIDLLIDATGEESLGHWMAAKYASKFSILSTWIEGPGIAVRTLMHTQPDGACFRCLSDHNRENRFMAVSANYEPIYSGQGCESLYVPFSASVSVQAASLAMDAALDWVAGIDQPTLRTRVVDTSYTLGTLDCSPPAIKDCPACHF